VEFLPEPVTGVSRPGERQRELGCVQLRITPRQVCLLPQPIRVHRNHDQLCEAGHRLAQDVAPLHLHRERRDLTASTGGPQARARGDSSRLRRSSRLLKAVERSLRHRSRKSFLSMDRTSTSLPVLTQNGSRSVKVEQPSSLLDRALRDCRLAQKTRSPRSLQLCLEGVAPYTRWILHSSAAIPCATSEVREPSRRDIREHRLSGYYR